MRTAPEIRNCIECQIEYGWYRTNKYGLCKKCRERAYLKRNRLTEDEYKKPYPLNPAAKKKRYARLKRELDKCYNRNEWRELFNKELEYMQESGIYLWCIDRRKTKESLKEPGIGKAGRKPKGITDMKIKWPDTRNWYD